MRKIIITLAAVVGLSYLHAQNSISQVLELIEQNNTTLKTLQKDVEAQKLGNKTDIFLPGPEVEFNYLWGNPSQMGKRKDFGVSQSFDWSALSGIKRNLADKQNALVELQYKAERQTVLLQAQQLCLDLIYYNALHLQLEERLEHARTIAEIYEKRLKRGESNILELNKAKLNLSTLEGEMARIETEQNTLLYSLKQLNGGHDVALNEVSYDTELLPASFENWYHEAEQKNPVLGYVKQQIEVSKQEVRLNKSMNLPQLSAGYMSEKTMGERFHGVTLGVSIPLWANKNKVKQAKASVQAAQMKETEVKQMFYNQLQSLFNRAEHLQQTAARYRQSLASFNSMELLRKALDAGQISLLDYMVEMSLYYDNINETLAAERDCAKAKAELRAVEL